MAFRVLFVIAIFLDLDIDQIDIKIIFIYSFINQFIYMEIQKRTKSKDDEDIVYKLLKAFYGLKQ